MLSSKSQCTSSHFLCNHLWNNPAPISAANLMTWGNICSGAPLKWMETGSCYLSWWLVHARGGFLMLCYCHHILLHNDRPNCNGGILQTTESSTASNYPGELINGVRATCLLHALVKCAHHKPGHTNEIYCDNLGVIFIETTTFDLSWNVKCSKTFLPCCGATSWLFQIKSIMNMYMGILMIVLISPA